MSKPVVTVYQFKLNPTADEQAFMAISDKVQAFLASKDGFLYRSVSKISTGEWMDIVYWSDAEKLSAMDGEFESRPECKQFMALVDGTSVNVQRAEVFAMGGCAEAAAA